MTTVSAVTLSGVQFQQLLSAVSSTASLQACLDEKMGQMKEDLQSEQRVHAENVVKKARLEKPQSFKSKGNEEQHQFLEKVLIELDSTEVELEKVGVGCTSSSSMSLPEATASGISKAKKLVKKI